MARYLSEVRVATGLCDARRARLRRRGEDIDGDGAPLQWFRGVSFSLACKSRR
jgi:hypothetical protein